MPILVYFALLVALWFDAPIWDDYDTILRSANLMHDARSTREWWALLLAQHNEHRVVLTRLATQASILFTGSIDFRVLILLGNLAVVGIFAVACHAYRSTLTPAVALAAALVQFNWAYYEASLMASAAVPGLGVLFFSVAGLALAVRPGRAAAIACVVAGLLAAASQTNGLLAWPLAAAAAFSVGLRRRAALIGALSLAAWAVHLASFVPPPNQPSLLSVFSHPITAAQLFVVMLGSILPTVRSAAILGLLMCVAMGLIAWRGGWRRNPLAAWLVAFLVLSMAAAAAARTGFGVHHASRYAIYSSTLLVLILLEAHAPGAPWRRPRAVAAVVASAALCVVASALAWPKVLERSTAGRMLSRVPEEVGEGSRYAGMLFPNAGYATEVLDRSARLGYYAPPLRQVHPATVVAGLPPPPAQLGGFVYGIAQDGNRVVVTGWTLVPAEVPGRAFRIGPAEGLVASATSAQARPDVALHHRDPALLVSGFRLDLDFAGPGEAARARQDLCVVVEARQGPPMRIARQDHKCPGD